MRSKIKNNFSSGGDVWFKETDINKIRMMECGEPLYIISTVCPDYSNNGQRYTFSGVLGSGISLTALEHLVNVPKLLKIFQEKGFRPEWRILVADLPEVVDSQSEFFTKISQNKGDYLSRCARSAIAIQEAVSNLADVQTFSDFYGNFNLNYLQIQEQVAKKIRNEGEIQPFKSKFMSFATSRTELARKFRGGRILTPDEILEAGAHGMSLYVTHGTLLRKLFLGKSLVVINHQTPNLQNFYLCNLVPGYEYLLNTVKFPLGILTKELY